MSISDERLVGLLEHPVRCDPDTTIAIALELQSHRAASQARALSSGEGWQDIATAPRDGELVLLCMTPHDGYLHAPMKVGGWWNSRWNIFGGSWKPTHWQPLPHPPSKDNTNE